MQRKEKMKIVFCGYFGFGNLGDEAILKIEIEHLKKAFPDAKLFVLSDTDTLPEGVKRIGRKNLLALSRILDENTVFVVGGGGVLQDRTSLKSLLYYTSLIRYAAAKGAVPVLFANGIGPILTSVGANAATQAVSLCRYVSVRDPYSKKILTDLGIPSEKAMLGADPVFSLTEEIRNPKAGEPDEKKSLLAVSLRSGCEDSLGRICNAVSVFCLENRLEPVFVPMQPDTDTEINKKAAHLTGGTVKVCNDINELALLLKKSEKSIGQRLHFSICSVIAGTPPVALSYDPKVENVLSFADTGCEILTGNPSAKEILTALRRTELSLNTEQSLKKMQQLIFSDLSRLIALISNVNGK